jgi:hypothetical protein
MIMDEMVDILHLLLQCRLQNLYQLHHLSYFKEFRRHCLRYVCNKRFSGGFFYLFNKYCFDFHDQIVCNIVLR